MEGISHISAVNAPQPSNAFEAFMIQFVQQITVALSAVADAVRHNSQRIDGMDQRIDGITQQIGVLIQKTDDHDLHIHELTRMARENSHSINDLSESVAFLADQMVTKTELEEAFKTQLKNVATREDVSRAEYRIKSYIDDKIITEQLMPMMRAEDIKINATIDTLHEESLITDNQKHTLKIMGPFPQRP